MGLEGMAFPSHALSSILTFYLLFPPSGIGTPPGVLGWCRLWLHAFCVFPFLDFPCMTGHGVATPPVAPPWLDTTMRELLVCCAPALFFCFVPVSCARSPSFCFFVSLSLTQPSPASHCGCTHPQDVMRYLLVFWCCAMGPRGTGHAMHDHPKLCPT